MVIWTRRESYVFIIIALIPTIAHEFFNLQWLHLPWLPIALVGTALAFIIGFQNNVAYDRIWEARKIWGGIVNASRTWTMMIKDMITNEYADKIVSEEELYKHKKIFIHRHIAWLTALRHAMRQSRSWEVFKESKTNREWSDMMHVPEHAISLEDDLRPLLSEEELNQTLKKTNKSAALLSLQSSHLRTLKEKGLIWEFSFLELENVLKQFFELQGKSERIKNFPYPRQYATLNNLFVWIFLVLLPFGVIPEFSKIGDGFTIDFPFIGNIFAWLSIPFIVIVSWIFHTMERIGRVGENPFEGSANDVPISTIARGIEIDIREMIDEDKNEIPDPLPEVHNVQI